MVFLEKDSGYRKARSLQQAASKGDTLTIPAGTYKIDDPNGVTNGTVTSNRIIGVDRTRAAASDTVGIIVGPHDGIVGAIPSASINIDFSNVPTNLDSDIER